MLALCFREGGFAKEKEVSPADPETTQKETKSPWCQHGGYGKKTTINSQKAARKETGRQELQLNRRVQEVTWAKSMSLRDGIQRWSWAGKRLGVCQCRLGILEVRLGDLGCSCCLFAIAFVALCSRWRVTAVLGAAGPVQPRRLPTAAARGKSCRFVAGAMQQSERLLLPPPKHHCYLESIIASSLPPLACSPHPARAVKGSAEARCGGWNPLPLAG